MVIRFNRKYFNRFLPLLVILVSIAVFIPSGFIRHTVGDFLVVIMMFYFLMSFFNLKHLLAAWIVLILATGIELLQYFEVHNKLNLPDHPIIRTILGTTFSYGDLLAYLFGTITVLIIERSFLKTLR